MTVEDINQAIANGKKLLSNIGKRGNSNGLEMDSLMKTNGYEKISLDKVTDVDPATHQGIDSVYYNPDGEPKYIITEVNEDLSALTDLVENAGSGGGESGKSSKPYTNSRPSFRKGVVEEVWENAKGPDGLVRDFNTGEIINWTPGESRKGVWDMGHIPEAKYSEMHEAYMNGEMTTKEFVDYLKNAIEKS